MPHSPAEAAEWLREHGSPVLSEPEIRGPMSPAELYEAGGRGGRAGTPRGPSGPSASRPTEATERVDELIVAARLRSELRDSRRRQNLRSDSFPREVHMRTNVYIDAFNLYYGSLKGRVGLKWLDVGALGRVLLPRNEINRIRYFTARVSPRADDPTAPQRQQAYFRALATIPNLTIHFGQFRSRNVRMPLADPLPGRPRTVVVVRTDEKGSDVNLATYLLLDGFQDDYECAVVVSNDSDLREPIRVVESELGKTVGIVNPHPSRNRSTALIGTFYRQLRPSSIRRNQFPEELRDEHGTIRKPEGW